jgi:hypothetical protein
MGRLQENEETLKAVQQVTDMIPDKTPANIAQAYLMQVQTMLLLDISKSLAVIADKVEGDKQ